jgi:hypothetical protein
MLLHYQPLCLKHVLYERAVVSLKLHLSPSILGISSSQFYCWVQLRKD